MIHIAFKEECIKHASVHSWEHLTPIVLVGGKNFLKIDSCLEEGWMFLKIGFPPAGSSGYIVGVSHHCGTCIIIPEILFIICVQVSIPL